MTWFRLLPFVASEGYCCIHGYLRLCKARNEQQKEMADNAGLSLRTIKYAYQHLREGRHECQRYSDCLSPIIKDIENSPSDLGDDLEAGD